MTLRLHRKIYCHSTLTPITCAAPCVLPLHRNAPKCGGNVNAKWKQGDIGHPWCVWCNALSSPTLNIYESTATPLSSHCVHHSRDIPPPGKEKEKEKKNKTKQTRQKKNQTNTNKPPSATKKHLLYKASVRDQAAVQLWFVESQPVLLILMNAAPFNSNAVLVTLCMNYIYPLKLVYFAQAVTLPSFLDWHLLQVWVDKENMLAYWINKQNLAPSSEVFISERLFSGRQTDGRGTAATLSDSVEHV